MGYRIKTVSELTGIPRNTLLAWERRYGLVRPERQPNGYREYDEHDVVMLRALKASVDAGQSPSEAISLLRARSANQRATPPLTAELELVETTREAITEALVRFDRRTADQRLDRASGLSFGRQVREIIFPVLRDVGDRWTSGAITVAHEHFASAWCRDQLSAMLMQLESGPTDGPVALFASFPGDRHELGLMGVAVLVALSGRRVSYLGADMPLADLCLAAQEQVPTLLCVSVSINPSVEALTSFARHLRRASPPVTRIVIGGGGVDPTKLPPIAGLEWCAALEELAWIRPQE